LEILEDQKHGLKILLSNLEVKAVDEEQFMKTKVSSIYRQLEDLKIKSERNG